MEIENSSRGILTAFFRQSGTLMIVFSIVLALGIGYLLTVKPVYEASGSLVVKFGADARPDGGTSEPGGFTEADANARQEIIRSYIKIILSGDLLRDLVDTHGVYKLYPDLKENLEEGVPAEEVAVTRLLEEDLSVNYDQTHVIDISVRNHNPKVAAEFATSVMKAFMRRRTEIYNTPQTDFLEQQIEQARQKLEAAQKEMQAFKQQAGISAIDEELSQLLREKSELSTAAFTALSEAQDRLAELETQEAEMRSTYRAGSPMLMRVQQTVAVARADVEKRKQDLDGSGSGSSLSTRIKNVDKRLAYLESNRGKFDDLQQQVAISEENYRYYVQRGEEARINKLLNSQNITRIGVVDSPTPPVLPIKPRKSILFALTLIAAMMAGLGTAIARELLDDRLTNPDQVNLSLGVPVLATFEKEYA